MNHKASQDLRQVELYIELLLNIKTATLYGSLKTSETQSSKVHVETNGPNVTVIHQGKHTNLKGKSSLGVKSTRSSTLNSFYQGICYKAPFHEVIRR